MDIFIIFTLNEKNKRNNRKIWNGSRWFMIVRTYSWYYLFSCLLVTHWSFFSFFHSTFFYYRLHSLFCSFFAAQIVIIFPSRINYRRWINERIWKRISHVSIKNYFHHSFFLIFSMMFVKSFTLLFLVTYF